ncbi:MAG: hypothetical protein A3F10_01930 [Coxiella sp. RIFCSPHIGHO2_12_FULL_42_15]|nr:MAG: hypothetical protein A3F10_01930 [Coxiella sp. RIFCSPHIGHO2_12_FULL_42_15]
MNGKWIKFKGKFWAVLIFNVLIIYGLATWFMQNVHVRTLWHDITKVHASSLLLIGCLNFLVAVFYAFRLVQLLQINYKMAFKLICIGNGLNHVLPFRLGDVTRIFYAKQHYQIPVDRFVAATIIERYCDLVLLLSIGLFFLFGGHEYYDASLIIFLMILLICAVITLFFYRSMIMGQGKIRQWLDTLPVISSIIEQLSQMLVAKNKSLILVISGAIWLSTVLIYYAFFSINLSGMVAVSFSAATILCLTTTLAFAIPYMIAGIGVFESVIYYYLIHFLHVAPTEAVALALVFHCMLALPQIALMMGVLAWNRIPNFMSVWRRRSKIV